MLIVDSSAREQSAKEQSMLLLQWFGLPSHGVVVDGGGPDGNVGALHGGASPRTTSLLSMYRMIGSLDERRSSTMVQQLLAFRRRHESADPPEV